MKTPLIEDMKRNIIALRNENQQLRDKNMELINSTTWKELPDDGYPDKDEWVLTAYAGVYPPRYVKHWIAGTTHHFGGPQADLDGKGSQPITHWMPVPNLP